MDPQFDRRDVAWIAALRRVLDDEPCPTVLADALSCMQAAGISLSYDAIRSNVEEWRRAWRAGKPWGNAGYVAKRPDGTAAPLLPALGLVAPQYGLTDAEAEERALAVALYTNDGEGQLFSVLNAEFSSATRAALGGELSPRLRACIPFAKLLEVALSELPSDFIFCGRAWRAVRHVFPGYPGFKNLHGGPSPQVHDPERHFADGSTVCWRAVSIPVHHSAPPLIASLPFAGTSSAPAQNTGRECSTLLAGAVRAHSSSWTSSVATTSAASPASANTSRRRSLRERSALSHRLLTPTPLSAGAPPPAHAAAGDRPAEQDVRA